jgi:hypothetical protein
MVPDTFFYLTFFYQNLTLAGRRLPAQRRVRVTVVLGYRDKEYLRLKILTAFLPQKRK